MPNTLPITDDDTAEVEAPVFAGLPTNGAGAGGAAGGASASAPAGAPPASSRKLTVGERILSVELGLGSLKGDVDDLKSDMTGRFDHLETLLLRGGLAMFLAMLLLVALCVVAVVVLAGGQLGFSVSKEGAAINGGKSNAVEAAPSE